MSKYTAYNLDTKENTYFDNIEEYSKICKVASKIISECIKETRTSAKGIQFHLSDCRRCTPPEPYRAYHKDLGEETFYSKYFFADKYSLNYKKLVERMNSPLTPKGKTAKIKGWYFT